MKYKYCLVSIIDMNQSFHYLGDSLTVNVGDIVEVPLGFQNKIHYGIVEDIQYYDEACVPYDLNKMKSIHKVVSKEEFINYSNTKDVFINERKQQSYQAQDKIVEDRKMDMSNEKPEKKKLTFFGAIWWLFKWCLIIDLVLYVIVMLVAPPSIVKVDDHMISYYFSMKDLSSPFEIEIMKDEPYELMFESDNIDYSYVIQSDNDSIIKIEDNQITGLERGQGKIDFVLTDLESEEVYTQTLIVNVLGEAEQEEIEAEENEPQQIESKPHKVPSSNSIVGDPSNYPVEDYGSWDEFYADFEDELDEDEAFEIWEYGNGE